MKILLDTCTFLWIISGDPSLSANAREYFADAENEIFLSSVSAWEISIKHILGRLRLPDPPDKFVPAQRKNHGIDSLALDEESTLYLRRMPGIHNDPFDRMLICQAVVHGMALLTPDEYISRYPVRSLW